MVMTNSLPSAASRGVAPVFAPMATNLSAASGLRFQTVRAWPALRRLAAMREPIAPSPRNATLLIVFPSLGAPTQGGDSRSRRTKHNAPLVHSQPWTKTKAFVHVYIVDVTPLSFPHLPLNFSRCLGF